MDDDLHDIDKLFYDALEPEAQQPSEKVWAKINNALEKSETKKPLVYIGLKRLLMLAAFLLLCTFSIVKFYSINHKQLVAENKNAISFDSDNQAKQNRDAVFHQNNKEKDPDTTTLKNTSTKINNTENKAETVFEPKIKLLDKPNKKRIIKAQAKQPTSSTSAKNVFDQQVNLNNKSYLLSSKKNKASDKNNKALVHLKEVDDFQPMGGQPVIAPNQQNSAASKNLNKSITIEQAEREPLLKSFIYSDVQPSTSQSLATLSSSKKIINPSLALHNLQATTSKRNSSKSTISLAVKKSRWYISGFAGQEWQGYQLQDNDDDRGNQQNTNNDKNSIRHREDEDPSLSAGINLGYQLGKKFSLETGIRFGGYRIRTDSAKIYAASNAGTVAYKLITSTGYAYLKGTSGSLPMVGDSATARRVKQAINYIGIPILLRYKIGNGKVNFNPALGFVFNFITNSTISANLNNGQGSDLQHVSLSGLTKFSAVIMFNPSVYYNVTKKISVGIEPYFNYSISPINNTNVVKTYPYGLGLGAGIKYSF